MNGDSDTAGLEQMRAAMEQLNTMMLEQSARLEAQETELATLRAEREAALAAAPEAAEAQATAEREAAAQEAAARAAARSALDTDTGTRRPRSSLPDVTKFSGRRADYQNWRAEMTAKMTVDGHALGGDEERFAYVYTRLGDKGQTTTVTFFNSAIPPNRTASAYLNHLDSIYRDPNEGARARERLRSLRQGKNESFSSFLPTFEGLLYKSGLGDDDLTPIAWLEGAINDALANALVPLAPESSYAAFKEQLLRVSSRLDGVRNRSGGGHSRHSPGEPIPRLDGGRHRPGTSLGQHSPGEPMDLRAGRAATDDDNEGRRRREDTRVCFRCDRPGHIRRNCPDGAGGNGRQKADRVARGVRVSRIEEEEDDDELEEYLAEDSGNE